jgi:hypothetical protein
LKIIHGRIAYRWDTSGREKSNKGGGKDEQETTGNIINQPQPFFTVDGLARVGSAASRCSRENDKTHLAIVRPEDERVNQEFSGNVY